MKCRVNIFIKNELILQSKKGLFFSKKTYKFAASVERKFFNEFKKAYSEFGCSGGDIQDGGFCST